MQRDLIEGFKVSPQQKRLWLQSFQQSSVAQCVVELNGDLQTEVLQEALRRVLEQHEILRTTFHTLRGMEVPLQVILECVVSINAQQFQFESIQNGAAFDQREP